MLVSSHEDFKIRGLNIFKKNGGRKQETVKENEKEERQRET
jgi:hypothetical protein